MKYVNTKIDFEEIVKKELKRLSRVSGYELNPDEVIYLQSNEIEKYRKKIEHLQNRNEEYLETNMQLRNVLEGLKKENVYLMDRLREETALNDKKHECSEPLQDNCQPQININIFGDVHTSNYPDSFLKETKEC